MYNLASLALWAKRENKRSVDSIDIESKLLGAFISSCPVQNTDEDHVAESTAGMLQRDMTTQTHTGTSGRGNYQQSGRSAQAALHVDTAGSHDSLVIIV